jgi:hypothetical protein
MRISPLQTMDPTDFGGLVTDNHLGTLLQEQPYLISDVIDTLYKVNLGGDDLVSFANRFPKRYIPDDRPYEWLLQGADEKNVPIIGWYSDEARSSASPSKAGVGHSIFYMEFPDRFDKTAVLVGHKPETYKLRVMRDPISLGTSFLHAVQLVTGDDLLYVPAEELTNTRWSMDYGIVSQTLSTSGTGVTHTSPYRMQNWLSMMRKEYTVPGNMIRKGENAPLAFKWQDQNGKAITTWLGKLDWDFNVAFRREKARLLLYGNSNKKADGTFGNYDDSGYEIRAGYGLYDQILSTNTFYYPVGGFDLDWLVDIILGLTVGKFPEDTRRIVLSCGEYGAYQFHKAVTENSTKYTPNFTPDRIVSMGNGKLAYQGQFVKYTSVQGISFEIFIDKMKDDSVRNKVMHPWGGTAESYNYDILDFGTSGNTSNIKIVQLEGEEEIYRYIPGLRDPFIPGGYNNLSKPAVTGSKKDGYDVFKAYIGGMQIENPMKCARVKINIT